MDTLDNPLAKKDLRQILADIKKAGYRNTFLHTNGYILTKKNALVKVRITQNNSGEAIVSTVAIGNKEIVGNIFLAVVFLLFGGVFIFGLIVYFVFAVIAYLISLPKTREFKAEIEDIIKA